MKHPFVEKFEANLAAGMDRVAAMKKAKADDPNGYQAWLDAHNLAAHRRVPDPRLRLD